MIAGCAICWLALGQAATAATLFQTDTFEDGTTQGWKIGVSLSGNPANVPTGGPAGGDDGFLRFSSDGSGAAGKPVVFNESQWRGDYLSAGITAIGLDMINLGSTDLKMRLRLESTAGALISGSPADLPAGSGWQRVVFPLDDASLVGTGSRTAVLSDVFRLRVFHAPSASFPGPSVTGVFGLDNVRAVPEPGLSPATLLVIPWWAARRRRRRRRAWQERR